MSQRQFTRSPTTQREKETPDAFWVCLLEADLNCPKDQRILASAFVDQSAGDIRGHFHRIVSNWSTLRISELRRIVKFVYDQREKLREEEKEREKERRRRRRVERKVDLQVFVVLHNDRR